MGMNPQLQTMIDNMPAKTGKSLQQWTQIISSAGLEKHGEIMKLLKGEHGVTHGFANTISNLYRQQAAGGPASDEDLVAAQYSGAKSDLKSIYEAVLKVTGDFGADVQIAPKKSYVSLRRNKQFAIVKPSTRTRVDLGLNLKGVDAQGRLEGGKVFSGMCSHLIRLTDPAEVDQEVVSWLRQAYEQS